MQEVSASYAAGSRAQVVPALLCPGEGSLLEPTLNALWCLDWTCLQPYLAKAEAWRNESKYGRAAHSSDGSMKIVDKSLEAVVGSPTEFVLQSMPTSTAAEKSKHHRDWYPRCR